MKYFENVDSTKHLYVHKKPVENNQLDQIQREVI